MSRRLLWLGLLLPLTGACGGARTPGPTERPRPRCPTADQLWPVLEWSGTVATEAVGLIAKAVIEGEWLRDQRARGVKPRIQVAHPRNRSSFFIVSQTLQMPLEVRLHESDAVTLMKDPPSGDGASKLDGVIQVTIRETLEIGKLRPRERVAGFAFEIAIAAQGVEPSLPDAKAWRQTVQITRRLLPAQRPSDCPEPTWFCPGSEGHSLKTGCGVTWSCRNGRFSFACEPAVGGKARCRCEGGKGPARSFELPDLCASESVEAEAQRAANRECGWRLPKVR